MLPLATIHLFLAVALIVLVMASGIGGGMVKPTQSISAIDRYIAPRLVNKFMTRSIIIVAMLFFGTAIIVDSSVLKHLQKNLISNSKNIAKKKTNNDQKMNSTSNQDRGLDKDNLTLDAKDISQDQVKEIEHWFPNNDSSNGSD